MTLRFVNSAILIFSLLVTLTGLYGIVWSLDGWMYEAHRIFASALAALIPWKTTISLRSLKRGFKPTFDRGIVLLLSILLSGLILFVFGLGLLWAWRVGPTTLWLYQTVLSWHWMLALILLPPFFLHTWRRWPKPRTSDLLSRQGFLKLGALSLVGVAGWYAGEIIAKLRHPAESPRRMTGSRLNGYLSGNDYPVTTGAGDGRERIDLDAWQLALTGAVGTSLSFSYEDLMKLPISTRLATLDCTIGWYSVQRWQGVTLKDLLNLAGLDEGAWSVELKAVSGYAQSFTLAEASEILLATHVGGEPLSHAHGFPLRAVVPSRRGWLWVKWLTEVRVLS